jgi:hypothetical protein
VIDPRPSASDPRSRPQRSPALRGRLIIALAALTSLLALGLVSGTWASASGASGGGCAAHRPNYVEGQFEVAYKAGCSGHDEPELDPVSNVPGSAKDLTWLMRLPANGAVPVSDPGPIFWVGGTVTDPNSLFHQAFLEVQFYPNGIVTNCNPNGGFTIAYSPDTYTVCSPVWSIHATGQPPVYHEPAAFNAMLRPTGEQGPLIMHARDLVSVHLFVSAAADGWHINVRDLTTGGSGTIVLNSKKDGPLMPTYNRQVIGKALKWGIVNDTPDSFVWEIGHTSPFSSPAFEFCVPGETNCDSYNGPSWAKTVPIDIISVTFADGSQPEHWAVVSDYGGKDEVKNYCGGYGGPFCIYPWYSLSSSGSWHYGVHFPDTVADYGRAGQFFQKPHCGGPFGPDSTYCDHVIT